MQLNQQVIINSDYVFDDIIKEIEESGVTSICKTINKFNRIMDDNNLASKNNDLEELIKEDVALALEVLKTANSPLFRSSNKQNIDNISKAINMVGWDTIYKIGMALTVKGLAKTSKVRIFANWMITRSIGIANISEVFLESIKSHNNILSEINSIYAYGLLHDIGAIALLQTIEHYQQDVMGIKLTDDKKSWADAEQVLYGFDHNMVGEQILQRSYLPRSFSVVARHHHSPDPLNYPVTESKKIALIRLSQAAFIDNHKFSEHKAFCHFNSIAEGDKLIREYDDFSDALKNEFKEQLGLTAEMYHEIISTKLTNDYINKITQQF